MFYDVALKGEGEGGGPFYTLYVCRVLHFKSNLHQFKCTFFGVHRTTTGDIKLM